MLAKRAFFRKVSEKGRLSLEQYGNTLVVDVESLDKDLILFGTANYILTDPRAQVYYKEVTDEQALLTKASNDITLFLRKTFQASHLLIIHYVDVSLKETTKIQNFQIVFASDGVSTYIIQQYFTYNFNLFGATGYSSKHCEWNWFGSKVDWEQATDTNTGKKGQFIFKVTSDRCFDDGNSFLFH